jgi:peptidyl-prolyl cis-trans isomerase B (cyclophilin B)
MKKSINPQDIKLIFFDIDDTLRVKDTGYMPPSIKDAIGKLQEKGIGVGIASGRAMYGVVPEIMALAPDYFVMINGQYVCDKAGNVLYSNAIDKEDIAAFVAWAYSVGIDYGMVGADQRAVSSWTPLVADALEVVYGTVQEDPLLYKRYDVYQLWTFSDEQVEQTMPQSLLERLKVIRWHEHSCDLLPINGSKAAGIEVILQQLGLSSDNIIVFGDGLNDIEMFDHAGFAVAMGNAHEEAKKAADFVTKDLSADGVAYALKTLGLID